MTGKGAELPIDGHGRRVALVVARFHAEIADRLVAGARAALRSAGVEESRIDELSVAGAFELAPAIRQVLSQEPEPDVIVVLGAVIRGETPHFDFVSRAAVDAVQRLAVEVNIPIALGLLTTDTPEQATRRADPDGLDKGGAAARAALAQAALYDRLRATRAAVRGFQVS